MTPKQKIVFDALIKTGILIGSRAWGGAKRYSDYDLVLSDEKYNKIKISFKEKGIHFREFAGFSERVHGHSMFNIDNDKLYFDEETTLNIITYKQTDLPKIKELNKIMKFIVANTTLGQEMADDKAIRIDVVEGLLNGLFKGVKQADQNNFPF